MKKRKENKSHKLISRNFCQKSMRVNLRYFHTVNPFRMHSENKFLSCLDSLLLNLSKKIANAWNSRNINLVLLFIKVNLIEYYCINIITWATLFYVSRYGFSIITWRTKKNGCSFKNPRINTKKGKKTIILNTSKYLNTVQNTNFEIHFVIFT